MPHTRVILVATILVLSRAFQELLDADRNAAPNTRITKDTKKLWRSVWGKLLSCSKERPNEVEENGGDKSSNLPAPFDIPSKVRYSPFSITACASLWCSCCNCVMFTKVETLDAMMKRSFTFFDEAKIGDALPVDVHWNTCDDFSGLVRSICVSSLSVEYPITCVLSEQIIFELEKSFVLDYVMSSLCIDVLAEGAEAQRSAGCVRLAYSCFQTNVGISSWTTTFLVCICS